MAIEGCCHGELDNIYATLEYMQKAKGKKIDLLICCGDFQVQEDMHAHRCTVQRELKRTARGSLQNKALATSLQP